MTTILDKGVSHNRRRNPHVYVGEKVILSLTLLELILSVIFYVIGHLTHSAYIRGVGVGLVIAWVTSGLAYFIVRKRSK